jgi:NAD(P)-dependent dehydrogenase (short-subunit alcohol dehydrogenase family)
VAALEGRIAVITGAGRGIGREHALLFAREGAKVVVNDAGGARDGSGGDSGPAEEVVSEIKDAGGEAVANGDDVSSFEGAAALIDAAVGNFGRLDVLVNNAGILRDSYIASMTEQQWDAVIGVHLKGHFATLHHAAVHWRDRTKSGETVNASVINTASASGTLFPNPGQVNYGAAKAGIAAMTLVAAAELGRYGARVNAILPAARTRMSLETPGAIGEMMKEPDDSDAFDRYHPRHVAPLVAWLASEDCPATGKLYTVQGGAIAECTGWQAGETVTVEGDWTIELVAEHLGMRSDQWAASHT